MSFLSHFSVEKENGDKLTHPLENWLSKPTCDIGQLDPVSYEETTEA